MLLLGRRVRRLGMILMVISVVFLRVGRSVGRRFRRLMIRLFTRIRRVWWWMSCRIRLMIPRLVRLSLLVIRRNGWRRNRRRLFTRLKVGFVSFRVLGLWVV